MQAQAVKNDVTISNFYMIGDNASTDIAGANKKGWTSILVKTGIFDPNAATSTLGNDRENPATYVVQDFEEAIDLIYSIEKGLPSDDKNRE